MNSLIRDVLFPSAAAIGLLGAAVMDSAVADESTIADTAVVAAAAPIVAAAPAATVAKAAPAPSRVAAANEALADEARPTGIERRCERTGRIGKFKITRCD
jgi:hypothetical protein